MSSPLPGLPRGLAITAIVLGALGIIFGFVGVAGAIANMAGAMATQAPPNFPGELSGAYDELMAQAQALGTLGIVPALFSGLVSAFMVVAGIQAVRGAGTALASYAALAAVAADLLTYVIFGVVQYFWMAGAYAAFGEATGNSTEAQIISTTMNITFMVQTGFQVLLGLTLCAFWIWAYTVFAKYSNADAEA